MPSPKIVRVGAKSAAVQLVDDVTAEVWFLTNENRSLRVSLSQSALLALAQRINAVVSAPPDYPMN